MKRRHAIGLLGSIGLASSIAIGSTAFSTQTAQRQVNIATADDKNAYLRLVFPDQSVDITQKNVEVSVTNQTPTAFDYLKVTFNVNDPHVNIDDIQINGVDSADYIINMSTDPEIKLKPGRQLNTGDQLTISVAVDISGTNRSSELGFDVVAESNNQLFVRTTTEREIIIESG